MAWMQYSGTSTAKIHAMKPIGRDHRQALRPAQRIEEADQPSSLGLRLHGQEAVGHRRPARRSGSSSGRERFRFRFVGVSGRASARSRVGGAKPVVRVRETDRAAPAPHRDHRHCGTSSRPPQAGHRPTRPGFAPGALIRIPHPHTRIGTSIESPARSRSSDRPRTRSTSVPVQSNDKCNGNRSRGQ